MEMSDPPPIVHYGERVSWRNPYISAICRPMRMFFALHPDRAQYAERANLLDHPEEIKIAPWFADAAWVCFKHVSG